MNKQTTQNKPLILAVDDEPVNLFLLTEMLEDKYELITADNGHDAIRMVNEQAPDLILLDISMPGISGLEVCSELKKSPDTQSIPIVFLTALDAESVELEGFDAGGVDFITKPFSERKLLARIKTHVELAKAKKAIVARQNQLLFERNFMESVVEKIRTDELLDSTSLSPFIQSYERNNGDILLSTKVSESKQYVILGDFTGHGLAAALCGQLVMCLFYKDAKTTESLEQLLIEINKELCARLPAQIFMAATALELNYETHSIKVFNCGLPDCLIYEAGKFHSTLASQNLPLGIVTGVPLESREIQLNASQNLVLHTDGMVEAENDQGELFGMARFQAALESILMEKRPMSDIESVVKSYAKDGVIYDDLSLVSVQFE